MNNINQQLQAGQKEAGIGSKTNYFKFENGDNRIRVLTSGAVIATHFLTGQGTVAPKITPQGMKASVCYGEDRGCPFHGDNAPLNAKQQEAKPSLRYTCYVIDRNDEENRIQLADLPYSVIKQIADYQDNVDYAFDSFPMPYDVTVKYNKESKSPNEMYKVIASPKREEVSDEVKAGLAEIVSVRSPQQHVQSKKDWEIKNHTEKEILITEEQRAKNKKNWRANANAEAKEKFPVDEGIEYPTENISPDDIPF